MADTELVAKIVAAFARKNPLPADELPALIATVHGALAAFGGGEALQSVAELVPAVSIRRSVRPDAISCLECGHPQKMLRRHLQTAHGLSEGDYRQRWGLPRDYPLVAPNYAARRSELAKSLGLGSKGRRRRADAS